MAGRAAEVVSDAGLRRCSTLRAALARRGVFAVVVAALIAASTAPAASAHAGLLSSSPVAGATLGAAPTEVTLSLSERPVSALSSIVVTDAHGNTYQTGRPEPSTGDPLTLVVPVRPLARGVYTVKWRVDSAVDGHATTGAYQFGVQVPLSGAQAAQRTTTAPVTSALELVARWILLVGLVVLLGAATAAVGRFGGSGTDAILLAGGGWVLAAIGLVLLAEAQRRNAASSFSALLRSPVGHALIWRGVAIGAAGAVVLVALVAPRIRRLALAAAGVAALAAVIVHVANGHAAASRWPSSITVTVQAVHFAVAGVWIGGLTALLIGIRGAPSAEKAAAVRRFSIIAAAGLGVIVATGIARAFSELRGWDELVTSGYGRAVLAKLALVGMIAAVAARNRRSGLPSAGSDLAPLRRGARLELTLAAAALAVAALLGTLAPPLAGGAVGLPGLEASGTDVSGAVRVQLNALSNQPGPNRFTATIKDEKSGNPIQGASVQLLFTPLDDLGVASTSLSLTPAPGGTYVGSGPNMTFDGRWAVRVLIARSGGGTLVPLELDPVGPSQRVTIERIAGEAPTYTKLVGPAGFVRISPHPERAGASQLFVTFYDTSTGDSEDVRRVVVTIAARNGDVLQQSVRQVGLGSYVSDVQLAPGSNQIAVVAHRRADGMRLRSVFDLTVPGR
jgi:copper transport protein